MEDIKKYVVEFTDSETGATSPIDNIEAAEGYTAADYIRDCESNSDVEYIEMLKNGTIELVPVED